MFKITGPSGERYADSLSERDRLVLHGTGHTVTEVDVFDPGEHTVDEVNAYLENAEEREHTRVIQAEQDGKARKGILE